MPRVRLSSPTLVTRIALLLGIWVLLGSVNALAASTPRIAAANWTAAETLIALGVTPYAVSDIPNYSEWVTEPPIPDKTIDIGLRNQPNLELLAQDPPDLLLTSALFSQDNYRLERLLPVRMIDDFYKNRSFYAATQALTRQIGRLSGHQRQAETLIADTDHLLDQAARKLQGIETPVYVIQFSDARHVRVFGKGNLVGTLFARTDLHNAWTGPTNGWGYASIAIDRLAETPDARIVVIKPYPRQVGSELQNNRIWQHLPAVREGRVSQIDPIWPYGGLISLQRLTRSLVEVMTANDRIDVDSGAGR